MQSSTRLSGPYYFFAQDSKFSFELPVCFLLRVVGIENLLFSQFEMLLRRAGYFFFQTSRCLYEPKTEAFQVFILRFVPLLAYLQSFA